MDDLISRKWLIEVVEEGWIKFDSEKDYNKYIHLVRDTAPSAEPERKKGKWIKDRDGIYHCSCCNTDYLMYELAMKDTHYCPNCGCRMEEGDSE